MLHGRTGQDRRVSLIKAKNDSQNVTRSLLSINIELNSHTLNSLWIFVSLGQDCRLKSFTTGYS